MLNCIFISLILFLLPEASGMGQKTLSSNSYALNLTLQQYQVIFKPYIIEYRNKKCHILPNTNPNNCNEYCRVFYEYVPTLPYKNARKFNKITGQCQPEPQCPKMLGVRYDEEKKKCYDSFTNMQIEPVDAPDPQYSDDQLLEITFVCKHGKVITFNGVLDCKCDLGYTSYLDMSWGSKLTVLKCQTDVPFILYLPNYLKIYYDPSYDNMFPLAQSPRYWSEVLFYYIRKAKYAVTTFFVPWEVQIVLFTIPQQNPIRTSDMLVIYSVMFICLIVCLLSCYQRFRYGKVALRKKGEEKQEGEILE